MPLGEFDLIARFFDRSPARRALLGIGDDCALLPGPSSGEVLAITSDMLVCDRHFLADAPPDSIGHKTLAVNLSDLAAMGARPVAFTLAVALPEADETWLAGFSQGLLSLAKTSDCELIGGDTTRGPLTLCVTAFGAVPPGQALRRDGARAGDDLWVSGELGAAAFAVGEALAGRALPATHPARVRMERPEPRLSLGQALLGLAHSAIDVSDGLLADLGHLLKRSGVGARLECARIPVSPCLDALPEPLRRRLAWSGGDDYELLFSAPPAVRAAIERLAPRLRLRVSRIGSLTAEPGLAVLESDGRPAVLDGTRGFDHFA